MRKCVFCGQRPEEKTKEHVVPRWLIEHTGAPEREAHFGPDLMTGEPRSFAFDNFVFPACHKCNEDFGKIEESAREVILSLLGEKPLSAPSLTVLLGWLDKVRIGLWLAYLNLNKNPFGIEPSFYINRRVDMSDRLLMIYRASTKRSCITFGGVGTPFFDHFPSCFTLRINQFCFVNASNAFMIAKRLGLPFVVDKPVPYGEKEIAVNYASGIGHTIRPIIPVVYDKGCTELYQPVLDLDVRTHESLSPLYDSEYVKQYLDSSSSIGKLFYLKNNKIIAYPVENSIDWLPHVSYPAPYVFYLAVKTTITIQNYMQRLFEKTECLEGLSSKERRFRGMERRAIWGVNRRLLSDIDEAIKSMRALDKLPSTSLKGHDENHTQG